VAIDGEAADGSPAGEVRAPYLGLDDWGAGGHTYRSHLGAGAGDGPWTVELAIEVTPLDA
jgi:hypothetical protein